MWFNFELICFSFKLEVFKIYKAKKYQYFQIMIFLYSENNYGKNMYIEIFNNKIIPQVHILRNTLKM